jgi:cell division protein ZipA
MEDLKNPMAGLDVLLNSAKNIAIDLNGELKDESRSVFTGQTEEHYRQRIVDYSRTQISGA